MAERSPYTVQPLSEVRLPWLVRFQLRRIRKRHGTGLLMHALIRTQVRSMSANADFHAGGSAQLSGELVADGASAPPGDAGVFG
jgi:hypothetical protein